MCEMCEACYVCQNCESCQKCYTADYVRDKHIVKYGERTSQPIWWAQYTCHKCRQVFGVGHESLNWDEVTCPHCGHTFKTVDDREEEENPLDALKRRRMDFMLSFRGAPKGD